MGKWEKVTGPFTGPLLAKNANARHVWVYS